MQYTWTPSINYGHHLRHDQVPLLMESPHSSLFQGWISYCATYVQPYNLIKRNLLKFLNLWETCIVNKWGSHQFVCLVKDMKLFVYAIENKKDTVG